ncbi:MAG: hypothetical protein ABIO88_16380 [Burkholderiaceae bacterium]
MLCGVYWAMKFVTVKPVNAAFAATSPAVVLDSKAIAKLLGAPDLVATQAVITPASSNYALFGLAVTKTGSGVALISTDGKPAKPYRVGSKVADEWVLKSISRTDAILATAMNAADGMKLELPVRQSATGGINGLVGPAVGRNAMVQTPAAPMAPVVQPQVSSATSFIPGAGASPSAGAAAAMANAANPTAGLTPAQVDAMAQRPVSRFAPGQADSGTRGRIPLAPPASFSAPVDGVPPVRQ